MPSVKSLRALSGEKATSDVAMGDERPETEESWAYQKQQEIILAMHPAERFLLGLKLCEDGRKIMEASILRAHPHLTPAELAAAVFDRLHGHRYSSAR